MSPPAYDDAPFGRRARPLAGPVVGVDAPAGKPERHVRRCPLPAAAVAILVSDDGRCHREVLAAAGRRPSPEPSRGEGRFVLTGG
jgi:hypothetical protein